MQRYFNLERLYFISKEIGLKEANKLAFEALQKTIYDGLERVTNDSKFACGTNLIPRHKNYWIYLFSGITDPRERYNKHHYEQ